MVKLPILKKKHSM